MASAQFLATAAVALADDIELRCLRQSTQTEKAFVKGIASQVLMQVSGNPQQSLRDLQAERYPPTCDPWKGFAPWVGVGCLIRSRMTRQRVPELVRQSTTRYLQQQPGGHNLELQDA